MIPIDHHHSTAVLLAGLGEAVAAATSGALKAPALPPETSAALGELERLGVQLQALGRVTGGHAALAPERVDLGMALLQLRAEWSTELARRGATLEGPTRGAEVRVSAGVLKQVLDLALLHALSLGTELHGEVGPHGVPELPTVTLSVAVPGRELFGISPRAMDELHWGMLSFLADATGLRLERQVDAHAVSLRVSFLPAD